MAVSTQTMVIVLSDEDRKLLETFAREQGIGDITQAVGPLLREYVKVTDEVDANIEAGLAEDMPPDHPIWQRVDAILEKIWANSETVGLDVDDAWLDEIRAEWNDRLDSLFDEPDTGI